MKGLKVTGICMVGILVIVYFVSNVRADNLLKDPGFELSNTDGSFPSSGYWKPAWLGTAGAVCTNTAAHTGTAGVWEYTGTAGADWWSGPFQEDCAANAGEVFNGRAWVRSYSSWVNGSRALVRLSFLDGAKATIASKDSPAITSAGNGWQQLSVQSDPAPSGTAYVKYIIYLEKPNGSVGQSIASFDDCELEKAATTQPILSINPLTLGFGSDLASLTFDIHNVGNGVLSWGIEKNVSWANVSAASGTTTTETDTITVNISRTGMHLPTYEGALSVTSNGGNQDINIFMEIVPPTEVPKQPALVNTDGYRLMVKRRLPDGTIDIARPYTIKGAAWAPASIGTLSDVTSRRREFDRWYRTDIQMLREMNANTIYVFLDFGTTPEFIDTAKAVLDFCYQNGIMVVMTVDEDGSDNTANIEAAVNAFKNHPAILMWALGNEWNLWRPDRPKYYAHYTTLSAAASAMQENALLIKSLDTNHPVSSILGEITYPTKSDVSDIVNNICTAVDVWGANIYRGPEFYGLFTEWKGMSVKPLFLSEFGTDAFFSTSWWPVVGYEDQPMQAGYIETLWLDLANEFSANDPSKVCLGGTVFEWNDEWWKTGTGSPSVQEFDGYETTWNPIAHPDGFANEEWFGIVSVNRERRMGYYSLQSHFRGRQAVTIPSIILLLSE
nr:glycoside hydrolase family 2 TIM barrel-domain containing protein [uncultured Desulfobulbus sp.]